jgi:hypothetical protein
MEIRREAARHWLRVLKRTPWKDHWVIDDERFLTNLAATWPWIVVYFEFLSRARKTIKKEDFSLITATAVNALRETLGIRIDCAACLLFLFQVSRLPSLSEESLTEYMKRFSEAIDKLCRDEDDKEWLTWIEELWRKR